MSQEGRSALFLSAGLLLAGAIAASAQSNLLVNGDFTDRAAVQTVQTQTCDGGSSAANWTATIFGVCGVNSGVELETDLLLGATAPFLGPGVHIIHIRVEPMVPIPVGDPANSGVYQTLAANASQHSRVLTSLWVYVVRGQAGVGVTSGPGSAPTNHNSVLGSWEQIVALGAPSTGARFAIDSSASTGAELYATNAVLCPADTDADLAACLAFVGVTGAGAGGTGTLLGLTIAPPSVTGGQGATGTLTLPSPAPLLGITATLSSNNPAAGVPPTVTVPAGQTSATFPVTTTPVSSTTNATITATSANSVSAGLTITPPSGSGGPNTGTITGLTIVPSSVTGGDSATGTVMLSANAPAGGVPVNLGSNNPSATTPPTVTVPQGQNTASFPVNTTPVSSTTTATITATSANSASASLTINPAAPPPCVGALTLSTFDIIGGLSLQGLVTLTANAGLGGRVVNLSSSSLSANVPATVTVAPGQNQVSFNITTMPVLGLVTPIISANASACVTVTGTLRLFP